VTGVERATGALAALKAVAYGGPVAVAFTAAGGTALVMAFFDRPGAHWDALVVIGVTGIILGFVEWALARRFAAHETVEKKQYEHVANIADSAAEALTAMVRATREKTNEISLLRGEVKAVQEDVDDLTGRVKIIEDRFMRPGMAPGAHRP
jgi:hypothetical protein